MAAPMAVPRWPTVAGRASPRAVPLDRRTDPSTTQSPVWRLTLRFMLLVALILILVTKAPVLPQAPPRTQRGAAEQRLLRVTETRNSWRKTRTPTWFILVEDGKDVGVYSSRAKEYFDFREGKVVRPAIAPPPIPRR